MNREMQIILEVNIQAENFYDKAAELGDHAAKVLGRNRRSQMTGLENIADSALKKTDIFDYIKRQTAKFSFWRQSHPQHSSGDKAQRLPGNGIDTKGFGERLLHYLEKDIENIYLDAICSKGHLNIGKETAEELYERRHISLLLIRQFIHQMVAAYEFQVSMSSNSANGKKGA
jgi:hypothetical protein